MRILLIQPPVEDFYHTAVRTWPLGLLSLATVLEEAGFTVGVLDAHTRGGNRVVPAPAGFSYLDPFYRPGNRSPFSLFGRYRRFGMTDEEIAESIQQFQPDAAGISAQFSAYFEQARSCAQAVKRFGRGVPVIMGGAHATLAPEHVLACPDVDWVVRGEGELPLRDLLTGLRDGAPSPWTVPGLAWRGRDGSIRGSGFPPLLTGAGLPVPARRLVPADDYRLGRRRYTMIQTSRGCPHRCGFCAASRMTGEGVRQRPLDGVIAEMVQCVREWNIRIFDLEDDHFPLHRRAALEFCEAVEGCPELAGIEFTAMNGMPAAPLDAEVLRRFRRIGFRHLDLALVSGESRSRRLFGRPGSPARFWQVLREASQAGLPACAYLILGLPAESPRDTGRTLLQLMGEPGIIGGSVLYVVAGTPLAEMFPEATDFQFHRSTAAATGRPGYTTAEQLTLLALIRLINFLKSRLTEPEPVLFASLARQLINGCRPPGPVAGSFSAGLDPGRAGEWLAALCLAEKRIFGLRLATRKPARFRIDPEPLDPELLEWFFREAAGRYIAAGRPREAASLPPPGG